MTRELKFRNPSFSERIKGMLGVDFYRLFHTPMFYIFLAIAAIIPAMVSAMTMMPDQNGNTMEPLYSNVWQIIAAEDSLYVIRTIADYANMNMVFIFALWFQFSLVTIINPAMSSSFLPPTQKSRTT